MGSHNALIMKKVQLQIYVLVMDQAPKTWVLSFVSGIGNDFLHFWQMFAIFDDSPKFEQLSNKLKIWQEMKKGLDQLDFNLFFG